MSFEVQRFLVLISLDVFIGQIKSKICFLMVIERLIELETHTGHRKVAGQSLEGPAVLNQLDS
jgi:hypothetical protein